MSIGLKPDGILERLAVAFNRAPVPLVDTQIAFNAARAIMAGAALGIYEALGDGPCSADDIASRCRTHPRATRQLLDCLVGIGYLNWANGRYALPPRMRKWLLRSSRTSLVDKLIFQLREWEYMSRLEDFVRTGKPIDLHATADAEAWRQYQDGMRDLSATAADEVARRIELPAGATRMLDIGGSHGLYSVAMCRRYPGLKSTVLELSSAIEAASKILAREGMGDRVKHQSGDALGSDLGENAYDFVFASNLVHHFTAEQNVDLSKRVARALRSGGVFGIGEFIRPKTPGEGGPVVATCDLYFALTSSSGTWSIDEITGWQREAGLQPGRPLRFPTLPGYVVVVARKSDLARRSRNGNGNGNGNGISHRPATSHVGRTAALLDDREGE